MRTLLHRLLIANWHRKLLSFLFAIAIWMIVSHWMTVTKQIHNIAVKVINLPPERTIENMLPSQILNKRLTLSITGHKRIMDDLTCKDLEVHIDAAGQPDQWIAKITKKNLVSLNSQIDLSKSITSVGPYDLIIKQSKQLTEKIPILVTQPIGEAPKGYQYLDIWPYQLNITVTGPEETVKRLKARGQKLTFSLDDISKEDLDALQSKQDEVSFFIPSSWLNINLPMLSDRPLPIDDAQAKELRIAFSRQNLIPIGTLIPISLFFPLKHSTTLNPETYSLSTNEFIIKKNGIKLLATPLYAEGVSPLFVDIVKDMIQINIIASPKAEHDMLLWNVQFLYPQELEDRYLAKVLAESHEEPDEILSDLRNEAIRNRFRNYMNLFRLYTGKNKKLSLKIELQANSVTVTPNL